MNGRMASSVASLSTAVAGGPFGSSLGRKDYVDDGVPVIRGAQLGHGRYVDHTDLVFVTEAKADRHRGNLAFPGDLIITQRGTLGEVAMIPESSPYPRYLLSQSQMKITPDLSTIDPYFLYYALTESTNRQRLLSYAITAGVPHINLATLREFCIEYPDLPTQRQVGNILAAVDDLIENNSRRIEVLERIGHAIYREWFVYFRYPGREHDQTVNSCLGPLPSGWSVGRLDDLLLLQRGFDLPTAERVGGSVPVIAASGKHGFHNESKVHGPGVVTGRSGTVGLVTYVHEDYWPLNTTLWVKEFKRSSPRTAYFLLSDLGLEQYASGAAVPTLNRNHIHSMPLPLPPQRLITEFDEVSFPAMQLQRTLTLECERLVRARDLLLSRLVTGEIDVPCLDLDAML